MHIADMTMFYAPYSGGVRTYLDAKRRRLHHMTGMRHTLVVPDRHDARLEQGRRIHVAASPLPFSNGYRFPLTRGPWRRTLCELRPDIVEAGDPYVAGWAAIDAARELDIPLVAFYHSDLPALIGHRLGQWTRPALNRYITRLYSHYDRLLAPSRVMADRLERMGIERVQVQPLGVDLKTFHPGLRDESVKTELGLAPETRLLIFAGRGAHEKNMHILLETMRRLTKLDAGHRYHLLMVGSAMPTRVPDNVTVVNHFCPTHEIARYLASSDALVHAGTQETFGLVVLEAMACGTPVVGTRAGALAENVPESCGELARPLDAAHLAERICALFERDRATLRRSAREHVERHHDWDIVVDGVLGHYRQILGVSLPEAAGVTHG